MEKKEEVEKREQKSAKQAKSGKAPPKQNVLEPVKEEARINAEAPLEQRKGKFFIIICTSYVLDQGDSLLGKYEQRD